jgi:hypothetical protein
MIANEEFCMQIDAHMDFVPHWDRKMMAMWAATENEYAVLSTYVAPVEQLSMNLDGGKGLQGRHEVPHLCMVTLQGPSGVGTLICRINRCVLIHMVQYICTSKYLYI